ncbi:hypothetical protein GHT07_18895 [Caenimonas koreensis DSM 17982]|uniref:Uncharacterized protein n=1 Tax=Caenimonas koreensis DSM 17982 TaxID=1121255 RepID=A0A844B3J4_9BURK|nr:hypothetical protein [Caenimonas koreensis]MRD49348.1 hypothetical protein [Caenimonas koreensis DSM 17982]
MRLRTWRHVIVLMIMSHFAVVGMRFTVGMRGHARQRGFARRPAVKHRSSGEPLQRKREQEQPS